jgi:hypothetical protein
LALGFPDIGVTGPRRSLAVNPFMSPPGYGHPGPEIESLNSLLRCELAAVESYTQALGRLDGLPVQDELRRIRREHETAAVLLRDQIHNLGWVADGTFGPGEAFAGPVTGAAGSEALLAALRRAEERRLADYEVFLQAEETPEECRFAVRAELLPRCHEHIDTLVGLVGGPKPKG